MIMNMNVFNSRGQTVEYSQELLFSRIVQYQNWTVSGVIQLRDVGP